MKSFVPGLVALALMLGGCDAKAAETVSQKQDTRIALFQTKTIFRSGLKHEYTIALTFDDGPNPATNEVLDELKAHNIKATFFIVGKMASRYPKILARIAAEGHLLANHSATHPLLGRRFINNPAKLLAQLRDVNDQIAPLMKQTDKLYFRAPYGYWRSVHAAVLNKDPVLRKYVGPVYWDIGGDTSMTRDGYIMSSADWSCWKRHWTAQTCAKGYLREIRRKEGGVVLMHAINKKSQALVGAVVPPLLEEGYRFVRLDQVPEYKQYETPASSPQVADAGFPLPDDAHAYMRAPK